jgi:ABC-type Na+ efflux pump permease subunit
MKTDWALVRAVVRKDLTAVRRSKGVFIPMVAVPLMMLVVLPLIVGILSRIPDGFDVSGFLRVAPSSLKDPILSLPPHERLIVLVNGYFLAPLFLVVPIMVSAVVAADAFAGEKERKTLESLLHLPMRERDLFIAKLFTALMPAVAASWIGFVLFAIVANTTGWSAMHRIFIPTKSWMLLILWVAPAVAMLGLAIITRVSARARTSQEANQLGGAVIVPLIVAAMGQASVLLLVPLPVTFAVGLLLWVIALWLVRGGARRFQRDLLAERM